MFENMPNDTFYFYVVLFWLQFVVVIAYGIWWFFQPDTPKKK